MLGSMDDAACVVDASGLVLATSRAAARFGIEVGSTLENPELRQLVRGVRASGDTAMESLRITRGGSASIRAWCRHGRVRSGRAWCC